MIRGGKNMVRKTSAWLILAAMFMLAGNISWGEELSPEATVSTYYNALKNGKFEQAAEYISKNMRGDKTKEQWANEWRETFKTGNVGISEISVLAGEIEGDQATVRIKTISQDRFNPQGIEENETDYLIKEDGVWKIDQTEVDLPSL